MKANQGHYHTMETQMEKEMENDKEARVYRDSGRCC